MPKGKKKIVAEFARLCFFLLSISQNIIIISTNIFGIIKLIRVIPLENLSMKFLWKTRFIVGKTDKILDKKTELSSICRIRL